jgi:hypothetical protein
MATMLRKYGSIVLLGCTTLLLLIAFYGPTDNWSWDPSLYYAHIRAPLIDGDFDFRAETVPQGAFTTSTANGLQPTVWPVGPSILWAPFFLAAHAYVLVTPHLAADGFSVPYIALVSAGSALYGSIGLLINYRLCRMFGSRSLALLAIGLVLLSTPLFFYIVRQPIMAHTTSYLAAVLLLYACVLVDRGIISLEHSGIILGTFLGLTILTRWASVIFVILPFGLLFWYLVDALQTRNRRKIIILCTQVALCIMATGIVLLPQLAFSYRLYDAWLIFSPYQSRGFDTSTFLAHTTATIFHTNRGLLTWTPFAVLGILGLLRFPETRLRWLMLICILAYFLLLGTRTDWFGGGGYSTRYFIELLPMASIGFVAGIQSWIHRRWYYIVIALVAALLILQQFSLLIAVEQEWLPLADYGQGRQLGLQFQGESVVQLVQEPALLLHPRPYVATDRQAILVNYVHGNHNLDDYIIQAVAVVLIPFGMGIYGLYRRWRGIRAFGDITLLLLLYTSGWFVFFLTR